MLLDHIIYIAGYAAVGILGFLIFANVVIIIARLLRKRKFADNLIIRLMPYTNAFRIGNFSTDRVRRLAICERYVNWYGTF